MIFGKNLKKISIFMMIIMVFSLIQVFPPLPSKAYGAQLVTPSIAAGSNPLVLTANGTVWSSGDGMPKELQDGTNPSLGVPYELNVSGVKAIAEGSDNYLVLKNDGTVWGWGDDSRGQLGDGVQISDYRFVSNLVQAHGLTNVIAIAAGLNYSLALKDDGTVWAFGDNYEGQLGDGNNVASSTPVQVKGLDNVVAISAGSLSGFAVKKDGTVWAWGSDYYGTLGDGLTSNKVLPVKVLNLTGITSISSGYSHTLAVKNDGTVWAWGSNYLGKLGDGTTTDQHSPIQLEALTNVKAVSAGNNDSLALKNDGTVWDWGGNHPDPVQVQNLTGVTSISAASYYNLVLKADGTVWGWGSNGYGELGDGSTDDTHVPVKCLYNTHPSPPNVISIDPAVNSKLIYNSVPPISISLSEMVTADSVNSNNIQILDTKGNEVQLTVKMSGIRTLVVQPTVNLIPGNIYTLKITNITDIFGNSIEQPYTCQFTAVLPIDHSMYNASVSAGGQHSLASYGGSAYAWGDNTYGQLGDGTNIYRTMPIKVPGVDNPVLLSAGGFHSLGLTMDGSLWAWGSNLHGQLGIGTNTNSSTPIQIKSLSSVVSLSAGDQHSLALKEDGTVWAWGNNSNGQLGDSTMQDRNKPTMVPGLSGVIAVSAGGNHSLALKADGTVWAWGRNDWGQLGIGSTTQQLAPVQVSNLTDVVAVSAGWNHSIALKRDGTVWAWGDNTYGELGETTTNNFSDIPVKVQSISSISKIDAGYEFNVAMSADGTYFSWGGNFLNQLGDGTSDTFKSIPVKGSVLVDSISAGGAHTLAFGDGGKFLAWGFNYSGQLGDGLTEHAFTPVQSFLDVYPKPVYYRLDGSDRLQTAVQVSQEGWNYGAENVVLARDDNFPDSLAGTTLAKELDAPLLLTNPTSLSTETQKEIQRLAPKTIYILGGAGAVSSNIEAQLQKNYEVTRLGGINRYDTAARIAKFLSDNGYINTGKAVIAYGLNFPDALAVSSIAAFQGIPILLTDKSSLPTATKNAIQELGIKQTIVVGGPGVISDSILKQLPSSQRYSGSDRYQTAVAIAKGMGSDLSNVYLATGTNFPDALAGSVLAAKTDSPIILVDKDLSTATRDFLDQHQSKIQEFSILGGAGVVSDSVINEVINTVGIWNG